MRVVKTGLVAAALLMTTIVCAQEKHHKMTAEERAKMKTERMAKQLTLTDAQVDKLNAINLEAVKKSDELRADTALTDEQRKAEMKSLHEAKRAELKKILTEEQLKQLKEDKCRNGEKPNNQKLSEARAKSSAAYYQSTYR